MQDYEKSSKFLWENELVFQFIMCNQEAIHLDITYNAGKC